MTNDNQVNAMYVATNGTMDGLNVSTQATLAGQTSLNYNAQAGAVNTIGLVTTTSATGGMYWNGSAWDYWQNFYYPQVIRESYPIYIRERAEDKGKQAFEVIKMLQDKKFMKFEKVSDFIDAMDALIKIL
jgi:hypothetical protein